MTGMLRFLYRSAKRLCGAIPVSFALLMLAACSSAPAPDAPYVLRYASPYTAGHPLSRADRKWMRYVEQASGGRLRIEPFWASGLISSDHNMEELRHGVVDVATITPIYTRAGTHAIRGQSGFYGGERSIDQQVGVYKCLEAAFPVLRREVRGLDILAIQGGNQLGLVTRDRPVRRLADIRGLRLRAPSELIPLLRTLNADPLDMPMGDVYPALAKGVIDGVVAPIDTVRSLHFGEVARYYNEIRISRGAYPARAISTRVMARLPADLQRLIRESQPIWEAAIRDETVEAARSGKDYAEAQKMRFIDFDPASQARFDELYNLQAVRTAVEMRAFGIDAMPMLHLAQTMIERLNTGRHPACPRPSQGKEGL